MRLEHFSAQLASECTVYPRSHQQFLKIDADYHWHWLTPFRISLVPTSFTYRTSGGVGTSKSIPRKSSGEYLNPSTRSKGVLSSYCQCCDGKNATLTNLQVSSSSSGEDTILSWNFEF